MCRINIPPARCLLVSPYRSPGGKQKTDLALIGPGTVVDVYISGSSETSEGRSNVIPPAHWHVLFIKKRCEKMLCCFLVRHGARVSTCLADDRRFYKTIRPPSAVLWFVPRPCRKIQRVRKRRTRRPCSASPEKPPTLPRPFFLIWGLSYFMGIITLFIPAKPYGISISPQSRPWSTWVACSTR